MYQTESEAAMNINGYTEFEQLESVEINSDIFDRVDVVCQNICAWVENFEMINHIRSINRQDPAALLRLLEQEYKDDQFYLLTCMSNWINSLRSNVQKNALILYKEIIQHNQIQLLGNQTLIHFLLKVLDKLDSDYKFLRQEATQSLEVLNAKKYDKFEPTIIQAIVNISLNQNKQTQKVSDQAYMLLSHTLQRMPITQFLPVWLDIFKTTAQHADGKSVECRDSAYALIGALQKAGLWETALSYSSEQEPENNLKEVLIKLAEKKLKSFQVVKTNSFKDFMALKKQKNQQVDQESEIKQEQ